MISQDDIAAFADRAEPDIKAAREFARRAEKGIPTDRWYDGTSGAKAVAQGIHAQAVMIDMLSGAFLAIWQEKNDATRLHSKDSKYFEADA